MSQIQYVTVLYFGRALVPKNEVGLYITIFCAPDCYRDSQKDFHYTPSRNSNKNQKLLVFY